MKLKQVFGESSPKEKAAPTVSICYLDGAIRFDKATVEMLGLKKGDNLVFFHDEDNLADWYFKKSPCGGSFQLKDQQDALYVYPTAIARLLLKSRGISQGSTQFYLGEAQQARGEGCWKILPEIVK